MTVRELIEMLKEQDGDQEVRLMTQQQWPFEHELLGVTTTAAMNGEDTEEADPDSNVVYLVEGSTLGYGRKAAWATVLR